MQRRELVKEDKELDVSITQTINDEDLRRQIRELIPEHKPAGQWKRVLTHPLLLLLVGSALTRFC
jgi:hypothetical protein